AVQGCFHHGLVASADVEGGDGHAPDPLAAVAPVGPVPYHAGDAGLAPRGNPAHRIDGGQGLRPEAFHRGEPLLGGPEDDRVLAATAVGGLVLDLASGHQCHGCWYGFTACF